MFAYILHITEASIHSIFDKSYTAVRLMFFIQKDGEVFSSEAVEIVEICVFDLVVYFWVAVLFD